MRMKDICAATGLTDRAVRLYIESGLVMPRRVSGYPGRDSILFSEADLAVLSDVAVLRRAGFSIADIRLMQTDPNCIAATVEAYRILLRDEIDRRRDILSLLDSLPCRELSDVGELAGIISSAAKNQNIPKEDTVMTKKELYGKVSRFVFTPISMWFTLWGGAGFIFLMLAVLLWSDGGVLIRTGGNFELQNVFTPDRLLTYWHFIPAALAVCASLILRIFYMVRGDRRLLYAFIACDLFACLLMLIPTNNDISGSMFDFEYMFARRLRIVSTPLSSTLTGYIITRGLKFLPYIPGFVMSVLAVVIGRAGRNSAEAG